jgi:hypothetical protein
MRLLITGSRIWDDKRLIEGAMLAATWHVFKRSDVVVIHGDSRGADLLAGEVAKQVGFETEVHPANWDRYGKRAGYLRNVEMAELGADVCLAFPKGEATGTKMMMKLCLEHAIPIIMFGDL